MANANEFGFTTFVEPVKENPYDKVVKALIDAGEGVAFPLVVPINESNKARVKFGQAARDNGKTARVRAIEPTNADGVPVADADGNVTITFTLTEMRKSGERKRKAKAVVESD